MDPVTLASITSALTVLGTECGKGVASNAGKDLWNRVKAMMNWKKEPDLQELPATIAEQLRNDRNLASNVIKLLQKNQLAGTASTLVRNIDAEKVIVIQNMQVDGDFNM